ncbi:hypothetical protein [Rhodococcus sp. ARC_M6]|uniref:hypothetical protein n=1 Tax=Rhodococcus sp. ARC_M6 TaxID=2928852 RepID=UPI001FB3EDF5|nr:hypothetical protein [Rhodococcus sp. ARC_M6]MCJ0904157.1 hypothetical protein [Rhodococcus sp. ARC_M6]
MKIAAAVMAAAIVVLGLSACSTESKDDAQNQVNNALTSGQQALESAKGSAGSALESAKQSAGTAIDQGKSALFVATFRGAYAPLAADRDDADIEKILTTTCTEVAKGTDKEAVEKEIITLAENNGTVPTQEQAGHIYELAKAACP